MEVVPGQIVRLVDGRIAEVKFAGETSFAAGVWVGVELEDATGKNDGSVQGERYFECAMGKGMFLRPTALTIIRQAPAPTKPSAPAPGRRASSRPNSLLGGPRTALGDGSASGKRMSLSAPSPSPGPKPSRPPSRPSSIAPGARPKDNLQSPIKSPTKQLSVSSVSTRTNTPANSRTASGAATKRPPGSRTSMGPPPTPTSKTRQSSVSSNSARPGIPSRNSSGNRLSISNSSKTLAPKPGEGLRRRSIEVHNDLQQEARQSPISPLKSADGILSPQPQSPVLSRTNVLEKLTVVSTDGSSGAVSPKFVPSNRPDGPRGTSGAIAAAAREIDDLKAKIRVLDRKRSEDREKIKALEMVQQERDKFEGIIQKLQTKYQPQQQELTELRKQLKEAEAHFESIEALQEDRDLALESATLDREMAEEQYENCRAELGEVKMRLEELELEVEILREENGELSKDISAEDRTSAGWVQLEKNNERLREALIRLRDLTQQNEDDLKAQVQGMEEDLKDYTIIREQHIMDKEKLEKANNAIEDLRQQLDNALGAEDMIEELSERNMTQAEEINELKAVIEDLESLKEINDELELNHVHNEREMQEELDFKDAVIAEQGRRANQREETITDMEYTLSKFRSLVTTLQSDLEDIRASHAVTETESEELSSKSRAMIDLNMKLQLSAAKTQAKTIDLELRRLDAQEASDHLEIVKLFLPDSFREDQNSVLSLLRFRRVSFKATLLRGFIKDRINNTNNTNAAPNDGSDESNKSVGHEDDTFAGCDVVDKLSWVAAMCDRFASSMAHCSIDDFGRFGGAVHELEPVERALNQWIDGLRRDELKEKNCATELQRTIALLTHLAEVHLPQDDLPSYADKVHMQTTVVVSQLESSATALQAIKTLVQHVVPSTTQITTPATEEGGEPTVIIENDAMAEHFARRIDSAISHTRSAKVVAGKAVRALEELHSRSLTLPPNTHELFDQCETASAELGRLSRCMGEEIHALLSTEDDRTRPFNYDDVVQAVSKAALQVSSAAESDIFSTYLSKLRTLGSQIAELSSLCSDLTQALEFEMTPEPWKLRAQELKARKVVPVDAEESLRRLREEYNEARRTVAQREDALSTAVLKIETLEARMKDAQAKVEAMAELEMQIEDENLMNASLKEDIDRQDRELKALEAERDKWKKIAGDSRAAIDGADVTGNRAGKERAVATAREMDALKTDISSLQSAVRHLRDENRRARGIDQAALSWLSEPLLPPKPAVVERTALVTAEGRDVLGELVRLAATSTVYDLQKLPRDKLAWRPAKSTPQFHAAKQAEDFAAWDSWQKAVSRKASAVATAASAAMAGKRNVRRRPLAALQVRLPDENGKTIPGSTANVQIVGSAEWEGLQGRVEG
ncbi:Dynactin,150 kDa isoform [Ceratocystis fimbriata CBS 114723]|uniref:Dynactin,150 kDa isoform n=1 Tax=Ceratocystis fimbriata CBS 114723 TaxID=1035309 RepID=A0A2C5X4R0_9PEZI|nr:Dynactin,150 kDa isoform [Ceratocystis fimbriata CBS 114723]